MTKRSKYKIRPIPLKLAKEFVNQHHRHHKAPVGWKFGAGLYIEDELRGVILAGRPVARHNDDGYTLEVTRACTLGDSNAVSALYGAIRKAAKALGYNRLLTYTLDEEPGTSLRASGWTFSHTVEGRSWSSPSRPRVDKHPTVDKKAWVINLREDEERDVE